MKKQLIYLLLLTSNLFLSLYSSTNEEEPHRRIKSKTACYLLIKNNLQVCNNACVGNNASIGGSLVVGRSSSFNNPVTINFPARRISGVDALTVNGKTDLNGNVTIRGDLIIEGNIIDAITNINIADINIADASITTSKLADGSVTEPKLANDSVSTRTIQNSAVTNAKLATATSANNPNAVVLRDGSGSFNAQNIEFQSNTSTLNAAGLITAGYKIIAGNVNANGTIAQGTGDFNVDHIDTGVYRINFTPSLATLPIATATALTGEVSKPTLQNITSDTIDILTYKITNDTPSATDKPFSFLVLAIPT